MAYVPSAEINQLFRIPTAVFPAFLNINLITESIDEGLRQRIG